LTGDRPDATSNVRLDFESLAPWIFGTDQLRRYTQDSPVMPDVWLKFGKAPSRPVDLLLEPYAGATTAELAAAVDARLPDARARMRLAYNQSHVAVELTFVQMLRCVLPLSSWWQNDVWPDIPLPTSLPPSAERERVLTAGALIRERREDIIAGLRAPMREQGRRPLRPAELPGALVWFVGLAGRIQWELTRPPADERPEDKSPRDPTYDELVDAVAELLGDVPLLSAGDGPLLWAINRNRPARPALWRSRNTVKADAATLLFDLHCADLCWAIIDSGIDADHPAFKLRRPDGTPSTTSRIRKAYDFTRLRDLFAVADRAASDELESAADRDLREIEQRLSSGRTIDWAPLVKHLEVAPGDGYYPLEHEHGTHVAGILAADWRKTDDDAQLSHDVLGVCPDIWLYDLRVFDADGVGDEFAILAALQFIRWTNANSPVPVIHGANLSLSLDHAVGAFACGRTPICDECERLLGAGTIVVVSAGNEGRAFFSMDSGPTEGYRQISITDPGNASGVITVGATHRQQPHTYGVSYFSSRGPTGDGRVKPDLVAPGEKITAPVPGAGLKSLDGTSQAAPHVSGAAALILARHPELIGQPAAIKRVLCETATDLGRDRYFQGTGVVDVLRAIQSI